MRLKHNEINFPVVRLPFAKYHVCLRCEDIWSPRMWTLWNEWICRWNNSVAPKKNNICFLLWKMHPRLFVFQFPIPHSRGSSHGQTRIIRRAYAEAYYTKMMEESYQLWADLEKESGIKLYRLAFLKFHQLCTTVYTFAKYKYYHQLLFWVQNQDEKF